MDETPRVVHLAGKPVRLAIPPSYSLAQDIVLAAATNPLRAFAAALGACWTGPGRPKATYQGCGYSAHAFGGQVRDELVGRGVPSNDITAAGSEAFTLLAEVIIPADEVDQAEGNSEAPAPSIS